MLGGELIIKLDGVDGPVMAPLARGDTVRGTTPASYPLDLKGGPVAFFTRGQDSIRVVVVRNPSAPNDRAAAQGRRLTVHLEGNQVVIDAK